MSTELVAEMVGAGRHALGLEQACIRFEIEPPLAKAHFLAQVAHESGGFKFTRELWGPTPAQARYEGRLDLGNTVRGDGFRFRGRGLIQITGRANYRQYSEAIYGDDRCLLAPEILEVEPDAALCAGWYWRSRHLSIPAMRDDLVAVTRGVNGGLNGLADRAIWLDKAKAAFRSLGADL
jgi:putative chitinase